MKRITLKSSALLLLTALIWGIAFVAQSEGMDYMGPFSFNGARFLLGGIVLLPFVMTGRRKLKKAGMAPADLKLTLAGGACCGLALCAASLCQQKGIMYTTVGKAGFITTLYIIIVPILGIFLKKRVAGKVWIGALIAAAGMYLLCMSESFSLSKGDTYVFLCAIIFSVHILIVDYFAPKVNGVEMSCIQFFVAGIICSIGAEILEKPVPADFLAGIIPVAYAGILSCGVAYTFQILGQKDSDPTIASLLLSLESVFSVLAGWILLKQELSKRELFGCLLVFAAVILVQLPDKKRIQ